MPEAERKKKRSDRVWTGYFIDDMEAKGYRYERKNAEYSTARRQHSPEKYSKDYCHVPPDKSLLRVRMVQGIWTKGPAQLVDPAGNIRPVVILGAAFVDGQPPEKIDVGSDFIMIEGVAASDIKPEQLLIQRADAG